MITINTVQGIGDLFWVYQKLAPHFDIIGFNVLCIDTGPMQCRALPFLRMLPQAGAITYEVVTSARYDAVAAARYTLPTSGGDYAVNAALELGINLRDIDDGADVAAFVDMGLPAVSRGDYLCAFVAGEKRQTLWTAAHWATAIRKLARALELSHVVLIGAAWDVPVQSDVHADLSRDHVVTSHVGTLVLADTINVIRGARFFVGFQSGLNVLAENYDVPQLMVYYDTLRPMLFTWCKPESVRTRFHAMTFADDIDAAIAAL